MLQIKNIELIVNESYNLNLYKSNLFIFSCSKNQYTFSHRRRIELEDKAKVVASVWGAKFVQFLDSLAVLPRLIWKNRMNLTFMLRFITSWQINNYYYYYYYYILALYCPKSLTHSPEQLREMLRLFDTVETLF